MFWGRIVGESVRRRRAAEGVEEKEEGCGVRSVTEVLVGRG